MIFYSTQNVINDRKFKLHFVIVLSSVDRSSVRFY